MRNKGLGGLGAAAIGALGFVGCGGSAHRSTATDDRAHLLTASRAPWQAVLQRDPQAFCSDVAPAFSAGLIGALAKTDSRGSSCATAMASRITDPGLTQMARIVLKEQNSRWLKSVRVDARTAVLTFAARKFSLTEVVGQSGGSMGVVVSATTIRVWLTRTTNGTWKLSARNRITLAE